MSLPSRIAAVVAIDPSAPAIEFAGRWRSWGELGATVEEVARIVPRPGAQVGILLRNRPASIGLLLGVLRAGGCVVTINPSHGDERVCEDVSSLGLSVVAGEPADLARLERLELAASRLALDDLGAPCVVKEGSVQAAAEAFDRSGVAVRMLTSGTTGPPKRIDLTYETLERVMVGAKHYESNRETEARLRDGVAVVNSPLVHLGGLFRVLQCVNDGRSFSFLERFTVDGWADAVRRHRPATASLVPAALRMVLDSELNAVDLSSLKSVVSGTAPLSPDDADAFTARFGIPVLVSYAATEFGGGVAGWNVHDYREFWSRKRGSVGRAHAGCELRVVAPDSGEVLEPDGEGLLEVKASQLGNGGAWVRTTDIARIDADGFLWILGRADQAIIRGGFKVLPDTVRAALESHPAVRGAAVVGRADARLGAVPVAAVELRPGAGATTVEELRSHAAGVLTHYEIPVEIRIVHDLPRTPSQKVDLAAVGSLLETDDAVDTPSSPEGDEP